MSRRLKNEEARSFREEPSLVRRICGCAIDCGVYRDAGLRRRRHRLAAAISPLPSRTRLPGSGTGVTVVAPPQLAPAKLVQFLKGRSSRMLQRDFPHLRKRYWGQHLWARGCFCATVGAVDEKTVMAYIESQKWDQDDEGFKITAPTEP